MLGSSQNVALPNVVLNTGMAEVLSEFADQLENAKDFDGEVKRIIKDTLNAHKRVIFNGNGYSEEWEKEAQRRGLPNMKRSVDAFACFTAEKNVKLFEKFGVMSRSELESRTEILYENYAKTINIESRAMLEMARRDFIPAVEKYLAQLAVTAKDKLAVSADFNVGVEKTLISRLSDLNFAAYNLTEELEVVTNDVKSMPRGEAQAKRYCYEVIPLMDELRDKVDRMEKITDAAIWPVPSYGQMTYYVD
jgi:glutamine synthetase